MRERTVLVCVLASLLVLHLQTLAVVRVAGYHLVVGTSNNKALIYHTKAEYNAIPLIKRVKQLFYNSPDQRIIQGIMVYDNLLSKATVNITAGGVNHTYVNLRFKSERGAALDYDVGIYA